MIISYSRKFIFIKGVKVGGTSAETVLSGLCDGNDVITPLAPQDEAFRLRHPGARGAQNFHDDKTVEEAFCAQIYNSTIEALKDIKNPKGRFYDHMPLAGLESIMGPALDDFLIIGLDRCPYRKVISAGNYMLMRSDFGADLTGQERRVRLRDLIHKNATTDNLSRLVNLARYKNARGEIKAQIGRYENLAAFIAEFARKFDVNPPALPHLKKGLMSETVSVRDYLSDHVIRCVNDVFSEEFAYYDYPMMSA